MEEIVKNLSACTDPKERDARALCRVFGWRWATAGKRDLFAFIPPKGHEWEPSPDGPGYWTRMPADFWPVVDQRFSDWHQTSIRPMPHHQFESGMPRPSIRIQHDLLFLQHAQSVWKEKHEAMAFAWALRILSDSRPSIHSMISNGGEAVAGYAVGDWSIAALAAVESNH